LRVEDIQGVGEKIAQKLRSAGYHTLESLAFADPREVIQRAKIGEETAFKIIRNARKKIRIGFLTGSELQNIEEKNNVQFTTGVNGLDRLLGGGIKIGRITEFYGPPRSGKTQLVHQLCVTVQLPPEKGGLDGLAAVIDTENTFSVKRLIAVSKRFGLNPNEAIDRVFIGQTATSDMLLDFVYNHIPALVDEKPIKLIAIDSLTSTFRAEYVGLESLRERQQIINKMLHFLLRLALAEKIAVVVTNQVIAQTTMYGPSMVAAGGFVVGHMSTYRVKLHRKGRSDDIVAYLEDAPDLPESDVSFKISDMGLIDGEKDKKTSTKS